MTRLFFALFFAIFLHGFDRGASVGKPTLLNEAPYQNWCYFSALPLLPYYKTNHIAVLSDGSFRQYAGLRFLAEDFEAIESRIVDIYVIDAKTQKQIDASKAHYVVNSKAPATFSRYSKYAFERVEDAEEFAKAYGGDIREFEFTMYLAKRDLEGDREYFKAEEERAAKKGKYIYENFCKTVEPNDYYGIFTLKEALKEGVCPKLKEDDLQAVTYYLWRVKTFEDIEAIGGAMNVPKDAKCPVCGMFVAKYPKWAAKIETKDGHTFYFDGVKDMMKYYFAPKEFKSKYSAEDFVSIKVTDYYTLKEIDGTKAFYVIGSNVYGPMGRELIPFFDRKDAEAFRKEHLGKSVLEFKEIDRASVLGLDGR